MTAGNISNSGIKFELTDGNSPVIIISMLGIISNMLLLVAFVKDPLKCFRNSATYLVINLSVCDCLSCLLGPLFHLDVRENNSLTSWRLIYTFCVFWFAMASLASITSISVDRFLMITYPLKHRILVRGKAMIVWLAIIWIVSSIPGGAELNYDILKNRNEVIMYFSGTTFAVISSVMYASTYYKLKEQSRNIALQNSTESRAQEKRILKEKHFLKTIIFIACIALVCIVPSMITFHFCNSTNDILGSIFSAVFYINFAVNPLIYIARFSNYRKTFHLLYCSRRSWSRLLRDRRRWSSSCDVFCGGWRFQKRQRGRIEEQ